jgi:molybdopterin/thiamine biosynthesis adenylyltransferase
MTKLNHQSERYARHLLIDGFTEAHQQKMAEASVFVAGSGGLGSALLTYLAAAGVGHLGIVDFDVVAESNLNRQVLYHPELIGQSKAKNAAKRIAELNPDCRLTVFEKKITADNCANLIAAFDLVADATDNFAARYVIDDACEKQHKPFVYASVEQWGGQISVFHHQGAKGYRSLYPEAPADSKTPGVLGPVAGLIGLYEAIEVVKVITGLGEPLVKKLMVIDTLRNEQLVLNI